MVYCGGVCLGAALATAASAQGRIEINHVSALAGGVTAGDAPGYPVTLSQPGSYVLTGSLVVSSLNVSAIVVAADDVAIDLQGFAIRGPNSCTTSCGSGSGDGIGMSPTTANRRHVRVRDGQILGVGSSGIELGDGAEVRGMLVSGCGENGIEVGDRSLVVGNRSIGNGAYGLVLGSHAGFGENVLIGNDLGGGGGSFKGGEPLGGNVCESGGCWGRGARRFYLTLSLQDGAAADTACATGFHMASWYELRFAGGLEYDATRGLTLADSGSGPPAPASTSVPAWGWVRTGNDPEVDANLVGRANCAAWTSSASGNRGAAAGLTFLWEQGGGSTPIFGEIPESGWTFLNSGCSNARPTWCIED